jgi:hypothetical protein
VPVTADGELLRDVPALGALPTLAAGGSFAGDQIVDGRPFALLRVVSAAPAPLRARIRNVVFHGADGIVVHMRRGPDLILGNADRMAAKWIAAARVLSSPAAKGATYIDLRLPERPAAGGLPVTGLVPLAPAGADAGTVSQTQATTPAATGTTTSPAPATGTPTATTTTPTSTATTTTPSATPTPSTTTPATPTTSAPATTGGGQQAPNQASSTG